MRFGSRGQSLFFYGRSIADHAFFYLSFENASIGRRGTFNLLALDEVGKEYIIIFSRH